MADDKVNVVEIDRSTTTVEQGSWYNTAASSFDRWRVFPRLLITLYGFAFYRTTEWFMALENPNTQQAGLVSIVIGAGAAWFGLYVGSGKSKQQDK